MMECKDRIVALKGLDKIFYNKIKTVKKMKIDRYVIKHSQCMLLADLYHNNYVKASYDTFCYGFYQGMQYAKNKAKKDKEGKSDDRKNNIIDAEQSRR